MHSFNRGFGWKSKNPSKMVVMDMNTNMFKQLYFGPKKGSTPYLGLLQLQRLLLSASQILLVWEAKTSNGIKVHLEQSEMHETSHKVSSGQKSEIMFWRHFWVSCLLIVSSEPNVFSLSVKIRVTKRNSDFNKIGAILTAQHFSNPGWKISDGTVKTNSQLAKNNFFFRAMKIFFVKLTRNRKLFI